MKELEIVVKSLKNGKSTDLEGLINELFKYGGLSFKTLLLQLLNIIKNNKDTPESWDNILISTIYKKKGSKKLLNNQRRIFITPIISKIFEKLIKNRISQAVENYTSLFQAGERSNRSTADNLFVLRAVIDHNLYIQSYVVFTLYDFKTCLIPYGLKMF